MLNAFKTLEQQLGQLVLGQEHLIERLLIALLADGHLLVEGAPGLAKTRAVRCLASLLAADFQRIQFTPDLLPSDITGTEIYRPENASFEFQQGPIFNHLVLADEINRAPAKVQSALLEAMSERQVSVGTKTLNLPSLFMVLATQNSIEQEGTYRLPEAQLDRFLMHLRVDYPTAATENLILELARREILSDEPEHHDAGLSIEHILHARKQIMQLHMSTAVQDYLVQLVLATRQPENWSDELSSYIEYGASPRATLALDRTTRARAWLQGRDFVTPEDIQAMFADCLRHRIIASVTAEAEGVTSDDITDRLLQRVPSA